MPAEFKNLMLGSLARDDAERLTARGSVVELRITQVIWEAGDRVDWVYFPETTLLSMLIALEDGRVAESGMIGREGAVGISEAMGTGAIGPRCVVQVPGKAWRVPAAAFRALVDESATFRRSVFAQLEFQLAESRQSVTCRSFHTVEARLARWLLESRDRSGATGVLPMTQEFLAAMLGVQRTTVSAFAPELQSKGLIEYTRGKMEIIDPEGLEVVACECRQVLLDERNRIAQVMAAARSDGAGARAQH